MPGMMAKPIIDILATVADFDRAFQYVDKIQRLGYEYKGENRELRQYHFVKGTPTQYHLYVQERFADTKGRIAFRNCLLRNPEIATRYATLKRRLAFAHAEDARAYQKGKSCFIDKVLRTIT